MTPEQAFGDLTPWQWRIALCMYLIKHHLRIKSLLQDRDRYADFSEKIDGWRQCQLPDHEKAESLFQICCQFELIDAKQIVAEAPREKAVPKPAVRTRGEMRTKGGLAFLTDETARMMAQVAELFTTS